MTNYGLECIETTYQHLSFIKHIFNRPSIGVINFLGVSKYQQYLLAKYYAHGGLVVSNAPHRLSIVGVRYRVVGGSPAVPPYDRVCPVGSNFIWAPYQLSIVGVHYGVIDWSLVIFYFDDTYTTLLLFGT